MAITSWYVNVVSALKTEPYISEKITINLCKFSGRIMVLLLQMLHIDNGFALSLVNAPVYHLLHCNICLLTHSSITTQYNCTLC